MGSRARNAQVTLLGRFEVEVDGRSVEIRSAKERALLARLALEPGTVVTTESLIEAMWPEGDLPADPGRALRYHVWHLRDLLEPDRADHSEGALVLNRPAGYVLEVDARAVDAVRLEADWDRARSADDGPARRRDTLALLLDGWRPAAFADTSSHGPLGDAAVRLDRLRSTILADRIDADLALGRGVDLVPEIEQLITAHPFDERLRAHLMVALYRAGRQADALAVYATTRALLIDELGVEPGPELRDLEQRILRQDDGLTAPTRSAEPSPSHDLLTNLPHAVDSFVGRDTEMRELHELLGAHRLVTLTGAGGTGKTRLAIETCRGLVDGHQDGAWLAELAPTSDDDLVATVVAAVWGLSVADSAEDGLLAFLRHRDALLLLDNCEHVLDGTRRLVDRVLRETPCIRILATSRESLGVAGEMVMRVSGLPQQGADGDSAPAAALFVDRGRAARPTWTPTSDDDGSIERICARLDGMPLGLEIAAGRLRSMAPREIADHLDQSVGLLAVSAKGSLPRHRTLAATVEWSYRLLSEPEQQLFRRAAVFAGGFDLAAALAVCTDEGTSPIDAVDLVDSLVDKSLVVASPSVDGTRYRLLEPLRQWAHQQLVDTEELAAVQTAHALHFARFVSDLSPEYHRRAQEAALRRTLVDYANIRLALATLADAGDAERHLAMTFGLFSFWAHEEMHREGFEACRRSVELGEPGSHLEARAKTALVGATCGGWIRLEGAFEIADRGRSIAEQLGDPRAMGWAELALAVVHGNHSPPSVGQVLSTHVVTAGHMQRAAELWAEHPEPAWWDPVWEIGLQQLCCSIFLLPGPDRIGEFRASRAAFQSVGDRGWLAVLCAQALDHLDAAGPELTRQMLQEGAEIALSPSWSYTCRYLLGVLHQILGDHEAAITDLERSIEYSRQQEAGWEYEARRLAICRCAIGDVDEAIRLAEMVFVALETEGDERDLQRSLAVAGYLLEAIGDKQLAARAIGRAEPWQDNYVDTIGTVRARLAESLGAAETDRLMAEGAASDVPELVTEVRAALTT